MKARLVVERGGERVARKDSVGLARGWSRERRRGEQGREVVAGGRARVTGKRGGVGVWGEWVARERRGASRVGGWGLDGRQNAVEAGKRGGDGTDAAGTHVFVFVSLLPSAGLCAAGGAPDGRRVRRKMTRQQVLQRQGVSTNRPLTVCFRLFPLHPLSPRPTVPSLLYIFLLASSHFRNPGRVSYSTGASNANKLFRNP